MFGVQFGTRSEIGEVRYQEQAALRFKVFKERLQWDLPNANPETELEEDQYDHHETIYVLYGSPLIACCRLIPTQSSHMISELWPEMLQGKSIVSDKKWELSRFAADTTHKMKSYLASATLLFATYLYATEHGVEDYVVVTTPAFERFLRTMGVRLERLGTTQCESGLIVAGEAHINSHLGTSISNVLGKLQINLIETAFATA